MSQPTTIRLFTAFVKGQHRYLFRYDDSPPSLYELVKTINELYTAGTITKADAGEIRAHIVEQLTNARCEGA